jgi:hypothetical protein
MSDGTPEATELIYLPEPSWGPALFALGLAGVGAGIFVWFPYGVIGAVIALVAFKRMLDAARRTSERLPREQKLTTAVLPAVPPKRP